MICYVDSHFQVFRNRYTCVLDQCDLYILLTLNSFILLDQIHECGLVWSCWVVLGRVVKALMGLFFFSFLVRFFYKSCAGFWVVVYSVVGKSFPMKMMSGAVFRPPKSGTNVSVFLTHFVPYI
jgi:hypothetical protein